MKHALFSGIMRMLGSATGLPAGLKITFITLRRIDFVKLRILIENVKACAGKSAAFTLKGAELLTIIINHSATKTRLSKLVQFTSKNIFRERNYSLFDQDKITIKL